jgi:PAS domain S-box-containing protein
MPEADARLEASKRPLDVEYRIVTRSDEVKWVHDRAVPVLDDRGKIRQIVGFIDDVTALKRMDRTLREREHFAQAVVDTTPGLLYIYDLDEGRNTWVNDAHRAAFDLPDETVAQPQGWLAQLHPDDRPDVMARLAAFRTAPDGAWLDVEYRLRSADGAWRWFYDRASVFVRHEDGAVHRIIGAAAETTDLREAVAAIETTRDAYNRILEAVQEGIWVTGRDHVIQYSNRAMAAFSGKAKSDLVGISIHEDLGGHAWRDFRAVYDRACRTLAPIAYEIPLVLASTGEERIFTGWLTPLVEEGAFNGMICTASDVTEQRRAAVALRRSEERFDRFMQFLPAAVFIKDRSGRLIYANEEFARVAGEPLSDMLAEGMEETVPEALARQYAEENHAVLVEQRSMEVESTYPGPEGPRDWLTYKFPIFQDEETLYVGGISFDITERNQIAARLRSALREKTVLLQEIHHRVKNNLAVVEGLLGLQAMRVDDAGARAVLAESRHRVQAMAQVHEHLYRASDLSRITMDDYVRDLVDHLYQLQGQSDIVLDVAVDPFKLSVDRAIPCALVLNELVSNAFKHGFPAGEPPAPGANRRIAVALEVQDGWVSMTVSNNGLPLPQGFDLGNSDSLGMVVIRLLVEQLGGRLTLEPGAPTAFRVHFPIASEAKEDAMEEGHRDTSSGGRRDRSQGKARVMIVEDEGILAEMTRRLLARWGYDVVAVINAGETAVSRAAELDPDVVLVDVRLAGKMNGYQAATLIAERLPVAVIFTTGYSDQTGIPQEVGVACAALTKPIPPPLLRKTIADLVEQVRQWREAAAT